MSRYGTLVFICFVELLRWKGSNQQSWLKVFGFLVILVVVIVSFGTSGHYLGYLEIVVWLACFKGLVFHIISRLRSTKPGRLQRKGLDRKPHCSSRLGVSVELATPPWKTQTVAKAPNPLAYEFLCCCCGCCRHVAGVDTTWDHLNPRTR